MRTPSCSRNRRRAPPISARSPSPKWHALARATAASARPRSRARFGSSSMGADNPLPAANVDLLYHAAVLLALGDSGSTFALRATPARSPVSSYWMLRWWVVSIYLWAGLYKLRADWLDGRGLEILRHPGAIEGWLADRLLSSPW